MTIQKTDIQTANKTMMQAMEFKQLPYDAELQWLKSTGAQWIDTNVQARNGLKISLKVTSSGSSASIYGGGNGCGNAYLQTSFGTTSGKKVFYFGYGSYSSYPSTSVNWKSGSTYEIVEDNNQFFVDGVKIGEAGKAEFSSVHAIALFCYNRGGSKGEYSKDAIHYFRIEDGSNVLIDLIPVRFTNENGESEGAMYDKVSEQLFKNKGTGKFILGPDKKVKETRHDIK